MTHLSERAATRDNLVFLPSRTLVDLGARYRFRLGSTRASLRIAATNLLDEDGFEISGGSGAYDIFPGRVVGLSLSADF